MKTKLPRSIKLFFLFTAFVLTSIKGFSTTYTAIASGDWSSAVTWGGTAPSFTNSADQVVIPAGITVTLDHDLVLNGSTALLTVNGVLISSASTDLTATYGTVHGTGVINVGNVTVGTGTTLSFAGNFTTNTFYSSAQSIQLVATMLIHQTLTLAAGAMTVQSGGSLNFSDNATIVISGGQLLNNGGTALLTSSYNVVYSAGATVTGLELTGSGLTNVTVNIGTGNTLTLSTDLTVKGLLSLSSGTLSLGIRDLHIKGDLAAGGSGNVSSTSASDIEINSGSGITGVLAFSGSSSVDQLTVNSSASGQSRISGNLNVAGSLNIVSGILALNASNFTLSGNISSATAGSVSSSANSNISITSQTSTGGTLRFTAGSHVNNFTLATGSGNIVNMGSNLEVDGALALTSGKLDIGVNKLTVNGAISGGGSNSYIMTSAGGSLSLQVNPGSAPVRYHTGTLLGYFPSDISLSSTSSGGRIDVGVIENVYLQGTSGADLSLSSRVVDATWLISSNITTNLDMTLTVSWPGNAEVHSFNHSSCYISHYINGSWDKVTPAQASASAGMYSITRANINSLSPFAVFDETSGAGAESRFTRFLSAYPNPTSGKLEIKGIERDENLVVEILGVRGDVIRVENLKNTGPVIDISDLDKGNYFIRLTGDHESRVFNIIRM
jgi:hypothetical protein